MENKEVRCPRCGSPSVQLQNKGYDLGAGCCGWAILGPIGMLCGMIDAYDKHKECLNCGHKWK